MTKAQHIAHWMFFYGTKNTHEGNWVFEIEDIEKRFCVDMTPELHKEIVEELYDNPYVLDVWGEEETGEDCFDVNFSNVFDMEHYIEDDHNKTLDEWIQEEVLHAINDLHMANGESHNVEFHNELVEAFEKYLSAYDKVLGYDDYREKFTIE